MSNRETGTFEPDREGHLPSVSRPEITPTRANSPQSDLFESTPFHLLRHPQTFQETVAAARPQMVAQMPLLADATRTTVASRDLVRGYVNSANNSVFSFNPDIVIDAVDRALASGNKNLWPAIVKETPQLEKFLSAYPNEQEAIMKQFRDFHVPKKYFERHGVSLESRQPTWQLIARDQPPSPPPTVAQGSGVGSATPQAPAEPKPEQWTQEVESIHKLVSRKDLDARKKLDELDEVIADLSLDKGREKYKAVSFAYKTKYGKSISDIRNALVTEIGPLSGAPSPAPPPGTVQPPVTTTSPIQRTPFADQKLENAFQRIIAFFEQLTPAGKDEVLAVAENLFKRGDMNAIKARLRQDIILYRTGVAGGRAFPKFASDMVDTLQPLQLSEQQELQVMSQLQLVFRAKRQEGAQSTPVDSSPPRPAGRLSHPPHPTHPAISSVADLDTQLAEQLRQVDKQIGKILAEKQRVLNTIEERLAALSYLPPNEKYGMPDERPRWDRFYNFMDSWFVKAYRKRVRERDTLLSERKYYEEETGKLPVLREELKKGSMTPQIEEALPRLEQLESLHNHYLP